MRFPEVQKIEIERSLATNLLLRFVRNVVFVQDSVVEESWFRHQAEEVAVCCVISVLEVFGTHSNSVVKRKALKTSNRLTGGNKRDMVKFMAKRLPCACLKELHSAARKKVAKKAVVWVVTKISQDRSCASARDAC